MADIARITGISESMLSRIANGERNVTPKVAKSIAPTLGVNWWELID
jgi:transcriptional regulator with XRE-family HTH domain|nr:MAG TPA: Helix-turn-helix XRE-family like protein [Caudoviricetes sp.]